MLSMLIVSGFIALFLCLTISKSRRLIVILGVTIILVLGGYLTTRPSLLNDLLAIANTRAFDDRIPPWTAAISMIESAPLLGHGVGSFPELYSQHVTPVFRAYGVYGSPYFNHARAASGPG